MSTSNPLPRAVPAWKLWLVASILAACETWINVDASAGLNWSLTIWATVLAFIAFRTAARAPLSRNRLAALLLGCLIAGGMAVTADSMMLCLSAAGAAWALAIGARPDECNFNGRCPGAGDLLLAPLSGSCIAVQESATRIGEAARSMESSEAVPVLRGILLATPIAIGFALLICSADPLLQFWRKALLLAFEDGSFLSRSLWFVGFGLVAMGLIGTALRAYSAEVADKELPSDRLPVGSVERQIILASVAAVFALFLLVYLSHLFGNSASVPGSGVTYASAAHEGFGELTAAASLCAALLIQLTRRATSQPRGPAERLLGAVLVVESQLLLLSAYYKIDLYENVYGFTELRLLVQVYASVVFVGLAQLGLQILAVPDYGQLARQCAVTIAIAIVGLLYWNHAAWIARANFQRYESRNALDVNYLLTSLGPDAVPEVMRFLPRLPVSMQENVRACLRATYLPQGQQALRHRWYEWSYRRRQLAVAIRPLQSGAAPGSAPRQSAAADPRACWVNYSDDPTSGH